MPCCCLIIHRGRSSESYILIAVLLRALDETRTPNNNVDVAASFAEAETFPSMPASRAEHAPGRALGGVPGEEGHVQTDPPPTRVVFTRLLGALDEALEPRRPRVPLPWVATGASSALDA